MYVYYIYLSPEDPLILRILKEVNYEICFKSMLDMLVYMEQRAYDKVVMDIEVLFAKELYTFQSPERRPACVYIMPTIPCITSVKGSRYPNMYY